MDFGKKLKEIRTQKKISQRELGERLGVSQQTIAQYEHAINIPKLSTLQKFATALGVPLIELNPVFDNAKDGEVRYADEWNNIEQCPNFLRFSALLKPLIKNKGMTLEHLAEATKLPVTVLHAYEQEKCFPKFETIEKIAKVLGVPASTLTPTISVKEDAILFPSDIFPAERTTSLAEYMDMNNKPTTAYFDAWLLASECDYMAIIRNGVRGYYFCLSDPENTFDENLLFVTQKQFEKVRSYSMGYVRHLIRQFDEKNTKVSESVIANTTTD